MRYFFQKIKINVRKQSEMWKLKHLIFLKRGITREVSSRAYIDAYLYKSLFVLKKKDSCAGHYPSRIHTIKRFSSPFSSPSYQLPAFLTSLIFRGETLGDSLTMVGIRRVVQQSFYIGCDSCSRDILIQLP